MISGALYVDGGLLDNLPFAPLVGRCDRIIAVSVAGNSEIKRVGSLREAGMRSFEIIANRDRDMARKYTDLLIEPSGLGNFKILDTRHADEIFALGYECCKRADLKSVTG
jgi:NTE family protein